MNLTGGGAFYSQTPESCLEYLGVNKGVNEAPDQSYSSEARVSSRLENEPEINKKLYSRIQGFENDVLSYPRSVGERVPKAGEGLREEEILRPSTEILSEHLMQNALNEGNSRHCGLDQQSQSHAQKMVCPLTPTPSTLRFAPVYKLAKLVPRLLLLHPAGRWVSKPAFTLAEILVTLGVIGIIAAMTLPMLARNYQFYIRQQQFKKAYAALNIAVQKTQIDMGEGVRCHYGGVRGGSSTFDDCEWFWDELVNNLHIIKTCEGNALANGCLSKDFRGGDEVYAEFQGEDDPDAAAAYFSANCGGFTSNRIKKISTVYISNSGFSIIPYYLISQKYSGAYFVLDINGLQGPNKWGYDLFIFQFAKRKFGVSVFSLSHSVGCHALDKGGIYTKTMVEYLYGQDAEGLDSKHQKL